MEWQLLASGSILDEIYSHQPGDSLPSKYRTSRQEDKFIPDPTKRNSTESARHWLALCDWYTSVLPHVILYDSLDDLALKLNATTLQQLVDVSLLMAEHNEKVGRQLDSEWKHILMKIATDSPNKPH